jgi:hypothetical protein
MMPGSIGLRNPSSDLRTLIVGGSGYKVAVADPRDEFPNNFAGNGIALVHV